MSLVSQPEEPVGLTVVAPDEALRSARPLPDSADLAIDGMTDAEWEAFERALAER